MSFWEGSAWQERMEHEREERERRIRAEEARLEAELKRLQQLLPPPREEPVTSPRIAHLKTEIALAKRRLAQDPERCEYCGHPRNSTACQWAHA